jgi:hypothetical protein
MCHIIVMQMIKRNQASSWQILFSRLLICSLAFLFLNVAMAQKPSSAAFKEEYAIFGIYLQNDSSTEKILGKEIWNKHFEADSMFPRIECLGADSRQMLRLFFHYGGFKNSVAEFELLFTPSKYQKNKNVVSVKSLEFVSKNGVRLGITKAQLIHLIGTNYKQNTMGEYEELIYYTENTNSGILKKLGGVAYFIKCKFKKGRLCQYNFGFEYP